MQGNRNAAAALQARRTFVIFLMKKSQREMIQHSDFFSVCFGIIFFGWKMDKKYMYVYTSYIMCVRIVCFVFGVCWC